MKPRFNGRGAKLFARAAKPALSPTLGNAEDLRDFILQYSNNWYWETDSDHRFSYVSKQREAVFGKPVAEMIGTLPWEVDRAIHVDPPAEVFEHTLNAHEPIRDLLFMATMPDGKITTIRVNAEPVFSEDNVFLGYRGISTDLTDQRRAEESIARSEALFRHTFEAAPVGISHMALNGQWLRFNAKFVEITGYTGKQLRNMTFQDITVPEDISLNIENNMKLLSGEADSYEIDKRLRRRDGSITWVTATVTLVRTADGAPDYFVSVTRDISAQKQAADALRESEGRFRNTFENAPVGIGQTSVKNGRWLRFNDTILELTGYTREEFSKLKISDITHPDDRAHDTAGMRMLLNRENDVFRTEKRYVRKDGTIRWVGLTSTLSRDTDGQPDYFLSIIEDIDERKRTENALRATEERYRQTFELAPVGVAHARVSDHRWTRFNKKLLDITGYSAEEFGSMSFDDITPPDDRGGDAEINAKLISGEQESVQRDKRYIRKDGTLTWVSITLTLARDAEGQPDYFISIIEDINERRTTQDALRDSEERYRQTFNFAPVGIVNASLTGQIFNFNDMTVEILGYSREELKGMTFMDITHPDDRGKTGLSVEDLLNGDIDNIHLEKKYLRKDGSVLWANLTTTLARDAAGAPVHFISIFEDISVRKAAEEAQRTTEQRFRAFWDNSPFNQSLKDTKGRFLAINQKYRDNYQLTDADVIGKDQLTAHHELWSQKVLELEQRVLATGETGMVETESHSPDKGPRTMNIVKFPVLDGNGEIVGVGAISYETTEQRRALRLMQESELRFRQTFEQAAVGIAHTSADGKWLRVNQHFRDMTGYTQDELSTLTFAEISYRDETYAEEMELRQKLVAGKIDSYQREKRYIRKDGSLLWALVTASLALATTDSEAYLIIAVEDISARKEAEQALYRRVVQQATVADIGHFALGDVAPEVVFAHAVAAIRETLAADECLISTYDCETDLVTIVAVGGNAEKYMGRSYTPENDQTREMLTHVSSQAASFRNLQDEAPEFTTPLLREIGTVSGASVNLIDATDSAYRAILAVHCSDQRHFTEDDLNFLQSVANILSSKVSGARIQASLFDREQSLNAILDNAAEAIVAADGNGRIELYNRAAEKTFGYPEAEIIGQNFRVLIPMSYGLSSQNTTNDGEGPPSSPTEIRGQRKDGTLFPLQVSMTNVELPNRELQVAIMRDVTEQRALQTQLIQASKLATVGEMAAGMAHELNQPLNVMRMAADNILLRMENGNLEPEYAVKNLTLIGEQSGRMGRIILHMRAFSRNDTADFEPFDPVEPVRRASELMTQQLNLANIAFDIDLPETLPLVLGRSPQLEQVILNLITNAQDSIAEHPQGEVNGHIGRLEIRAWADTSSGSVRIVSRDTGAGIPVGVKDKLFDPFFTTKDVGVGTGLGLSVSYGIISSMGGSIEARNTGNGAEFIITLPISRKPN